MQLATEPGSAPGTTTPEPTAPTDWRASLPESYEVKDDKGGVTKVALRGDPTLGRYKTGEEAARALIEQHKALSSSGKIPGADAKPEEVRAFWDKLGVPKDATGYSAVKVPEVAGVSFSEDGLKAFYENVALREGMTPKQVQAAVNFLAEHQGQQLQALKGGWIDGQDTLRSEWGLNFDRNVTIARRGMDHALKAAGADGLRDVLIGPGIEENPDFIRFAYWVGRNLSEDGILPGHGDGANTQAELEQKIATVEAQFFKATPGTPDYTRLREERDQLLKQRYGTEEVGARAPQK